MADPVEIMARAICVDPDERAGPNGEPTWRYSIPNSRAAIAALESAGYRIAGPEPTEEMYRAGRGEMPIQAAYKVENGKLVARLHDEAECVSPNRVWTAMHAKLPLYGSE